MLLSSKSSCPYLTKEVVMSIRFRYRYRDTAIENGIFFSSMKIFSLQACILCGHIRWFALNTVACWENLSYINSNFSRQEPAMKNFYICAYYTGVIFLKILLVHIRVRFTKHLFCPSIILKKQLSSSTEKHCLLPQNYISRDNQRNNDVNSFRYFNNHVYQSSVATRID